MADASNKPYFNGLLKLQAKGRNRRRVTPELVDRNRREDRKLYAKYVVKGWENVFDKKGEAVTFTPAVCEEFLGAIETWMFDEFRDFCADPSSFLSDNADSGESDTEDISKN